MLSKHTTFVKLYSINNIQAMHACIVLGCKCIEIKGRSPGGKIGYNVMHTVTTNRQDEANTSLCQYIRTRLQFVIMH